MKLSKKNKLILILSASVLCGAAGIWLFNSAKAEPQAMRIVAKDFSPGTKISYKVFSKDEYLGNGQQSVGKDGAIELALPGHPDLQDKEKLVYNIEVEKSRIDEMMDIKDPMKIVVGIDQLTKSVTFEGSGFPEFSDLSLTAGDKTKISKTDWSGNFAESGPTQGEAEQAVKLAFQNMNLASDADAMNPNGAVEVFFGNSNGSSTAKVNERYGKALIMMTTQLSAVMMQQAEIIGTLLDAKMQLETQRTLQEMQARAHKDYHPSEQMCRFGTFVRSVAATEVLAEHTKRTLNRYLMDQYLGVENSSAAEGTGISSKSRVENFIKTHCDPYDNNGALTLLCKDAILATTTPAQMERFNMDVDYTRTLDNKLTVNIDFSDGNLTNDEEDIIAMAHNLYYPTALGSTKTESLIADPRGHYDTRVFAAKMNVAHNSFINIVGMKSSAPVARQTPSPLPNPPPQIANTRGPVPPVSNYTEDAGWTYMKSMLREFGIVDRNGSGSSDDEIHGLLGERPSYYAQMEVLTKKIYQNPDFYTNLYDKPANVERIGAAMDAISIMNQRDRYESLLRREMLTSVLVEEGLGPDVEDVNARIFSAMQQVQNRTR